jgi:DNA replication protein DnaC
VEKLLEAKRDLRLSRELQRLDRFECLALDDIGYVQQDRSEMEVLFTLLAERYERRSVMITSNLVFSKWDQIFKDPMTTAAAIDRVVHHPVIRLRRGPQDVRRDIQVPLAPSVSRRVIPLPRPSCAHLRYFANARAQARTMT